MIHPRQFRGAAVAALFALVSLARAGTPVGILMRRAWDGT